MKNALAVFNFKSTEVRTIEKDGLIWFVASDIAKALDYAEAKDMTRALDEDEKGRHIVPTPSGDQEMIVINESGMYHAILKSRKPEAQPFRKWVTSEVLPSIRKSGGYTAPAKQARPLLKHSGGMTRDLRHRINVRAHALSESAYEEYRRRMTNDVMVSAGHTAPEDWEPVESTQETLDSIETTAYMMEAGAQVLRNRGYRLAAVVGVDFDKSVAKFRPEKTD